MARCHWSVEQFDGTCPMKPALTVAAEWYRVRSVTGSVTMIDEPYVHELLRANIWHVRGASRDLVVDAGLGVASLRNSLPVVFERNPVLVVTHAHLDHVGSAHEFDDRRMHRTSLVDENTAASLNGPELARLLGLDLPGAVLPEWLIRALPFDGFEPHRYAISPAPATVALEDGDTIDLGDMTLRVLHMPGHTPGSVCLFNEADGSLFSGDVIYDDVLLDELPESDVADYVSSMLRLRALPVKIVYPGHGDPFDGDRMRQVIDEYVGRRAARSTSDR